MANYTNDSMNFSLQQIFNIQIKRNNKKTVRKDMKYYLFLSFFVFCLQNSFGQQKISGRFDSKTQQFITDNEEYHIDFFQGDVARIYKGGYVGLMNNKGETLVKPKYDQIYPFQGDLAKINIHKRNGLINRKGE
ncbi:MAG: WG repeat-containing protein, partial [Crocinitomicaceae bacterium]